MIPICNKPTRGKPFEMGRFIIFLEYLPGLVAEHLITNRPAWQYTLALSEEGFLVEDACQGEAPSDDAA